MPVAGGGTPRRDRAPDARDRAVPVTGIQTAVTLYTLVMAMFMITGGKVGALIGRRYAESDQCGGGEAFGCFAPALTRDLTCSSSRSSSESSIHADGDEYSGRHVFGGASEEPRHGRAEREAEQRHAGLEGHEQQRDPPALPQVQP